MAINLQQKAALKRTAAKQCTNSYPQDQQIIRQSWKAANIETAVGNPLPLSTALPPGQAALQATEGTDQQLCTRKEFSIYADATAWC